MSSIWGFVLHQLYSRTVIAIAMLFGVLAGPFSSYAATHVVELYDFYYLPQDITITQGDTVDFVWVDAFHDAVAGNVPGMSPFPYQDAFRTPIDDQLPFSIQVTFDRNLLINFPAPNNRYDYYCSPHFTQGMLGSVTVTRTPTNFETSAVGWQVVPETGSSATADCSAVLNGDETELALNCTHNVQGATSVEVRSGFLGDTGNVICDLNTASPLNATCNIPSQTEANRLYDGGYYFLISSATHPNGEIRGQLVRTSSNRTITGTVKLPNDEPLSGVIISDGTRNATSDSSGNYIISNVPSGVYRLSASKDGFSITADEDVSPVMVNANDPNNRDFTASLGATCSADRDGDGVCDPQEEADGSNADDPGSFKAHRKSPIRVLWNGFIDILNIVAITNSGNTTIPVHAELFDINGNQVNEIDISVPANGEFDLIVNDLNGFSRDSFGILSLEFADEFEDIIDGQIFYYRLDSANSGYEFAFGVPFVEPTYGNSAVGFNTFQPSRNALQSANQVAQWLSLVNLDQFAQKSFTLEKYDQLGALLSTQRVTLQPFGRMDVEAGHVDPGPSTVGLMVIKPDDENAAYMGQLYRYGGNSPAGEATTSYSFAFPLLARAGNGEVQRAPISIGGGAENWVEVINASSTNVEVALEFHASSGELLAEERLTLAPYAQRHVNAGIYLDDGASGSVVIRPASTNSVVGQSMFYFRDPSDGSITGMYGTAFRESFSTKISGSYNLFLGMFNWLKLINTESATTVATVKVFSPTGVANTREIELAPHAAVDLGLHETQYDTAADTFGIVTVETSSPRSILSEVLRTRLNPDNTIDFAAPTPLR